MSLPGSKASDFRVVRFGILGVRILGFAGLALAGHNENGFKVSGRGLWEFGSFLPWQHVAVLVHERKSSRVAG